MDSTSRPLRGALVGAGKVALEGHLPGWRQAGVARIVAGTDRDRSRERYFRSAAPDAHWHDRFETLLAREALDFVDICAPPAAHFELVRDALEHGLHVLCEKPLVFDPANLNRLADLARGTGRTLYTVHNWHHAPVVRRIHDLLGQGAIGRLRHCAWRVLRTRPAGDGLEDGRNWRVDPAISGGGVLLDHGWHALYLVNSLVGEAASQVSARLETRRHRQWPVEDTASVHLTYPGARADLFLSWASDVRGNEIVLEGSDGSLAVKDATLTLHDAGGEEQILTSLGPLSAGSYHPEWFGNVARAFVKACDGTGPGNLGEARACVTLIHLAQSSSRNQGAALEVPALPAAPGAQARPGKTVTGGQHH